MAGVNFLQPRVCRDEMKPTLALLIVVHLLLSAAFGAQETVIHTFVFKTVGALEIKLDAHRPDDQEIRPLAVWIHGGALINGGRQGIGPAGKTLLDAGYCVVSIDSQIMAREFEKHRVPHQFITIEGGEHGLAGAKRESADAAYAAVLPFIEKYMKR